VAADVLRLAGEAPALGPWGELQTGISKALRREGIACEFLSPQSGLSFMFNMDAAEAAMARGEWPAGPLDEAALLTIDRGDADISANFREQVDWAYRGLAFQARYPHKNLRALARVMQPQYAGFAVTFESGITSLEQIGREQRPLRLLTVSPSITKFQTRMMGYVHSRVFELCGFTQPELVAWGGKIWGAADGLRAIAERDVDMLALPAYPNWGPVWGQMWLQAHCRLNLRFLPVPEHAREQMSAELGLRPGEMPARLFRGLTSPVPTFVFADHTVITHAGLDDEAAYHVVQALDRHPEALLEQQHTFAFNPFLAWRELGAPLHPGAERYYRERGYMQER
jgi:hypothetical protein